MKIPSGWQKYAQGSYVEDVPLGKSPSIVEWYSAQESNCGRRGWHAWTARTAAGGRPIGVYSTARDAFDALGLAGRLGRPLDRVR